jgi:2-iminobutanoate/2-iminopropanoate deaminase
MEIIFTPQAPAPAGHYSQAIRHAGLVYIAGQLPIDPASGEKCSGPISEQTRQVLQNLEQILRAAGSDLAHVLRVTIYISDIALWGEVNRVYAEVFGDHRPARSMVPTRELHFGFKVEIDAIAAVAD